jgi:hypothetical protein
MDMPVGKLLIVLGGLLVVAGLLIYLIGDHWPDWLIPGRLPGDIRIEWPQSSGGGGFYFPIVTCLLVSILLSLVVALVKRFF